MTEQVIAIVVVLCLILLACGCLNRPHWRIGPKKEYHKIVTRFGNPSFVNSTPNGAAVWKIFKKDCPFVRLMVVDESVPHDTPGSHCDYTYTTINYYIDPKKLMDVLAISDSLMYDKLKEELTSRCSTLEANMAILVLADKVHKSIITNSQVADGITYKKYIADSQKFAVENYRLLQDINAVYQMREADYIRCDR
jgi:hypothetical protein